MSLYTGNAHAMIDYIVESSSRLGLLSPTSNAYLTQAGNLGIDADAAEASMEAFLGAEVSEASSEIPEGSEAALRTLVMIHGIDYDAWYGEVQDEIV